MQIIDELKKEYTLKGVGIPEYYLGGDVEINAKYGMQLSAKTYIKNVTERIEKMFETRLRHYGSPLEDNYHPELDESDLLDADDVTRYQMLLGCANWLVTLGRLDIYYAVSTMAKYAQAPRQGHLKVLLRIFGYLKHYMRGKITIETSKEEKDDAKEVKHNWQDMYPGVREEIPYNCPTSLGKSVTTKVLFDASHAHDIDTRKSVTGVLLYVNGTLMKWYCKRQNTVESSTYGSELVAARIATDLVVELRYNLRMLGVKVEGPTKMYGDNQSVIVNTSLPSSSLKKKHNAVSYHRVREAVAADIIRLFHIPGTQNTADVLTKPLGPKTHYELMKPVLF